MIKTARLSLVSMKCHSLLIHEYCHHMQCFFLISSADSGISPSGFLLCDAEDFDGLTKFGKKQILKISTEVKGIVNLNSSLSA